MCDLYICLYNKEDTSIRICTIIIVNRALLMCNKTQSTASNVIGYKLNVLISSNILILFNL